MTPAEARAEWVRDLRSGKFKQARLSLKEPDGYCCLGVGCETYRRFHPDAGDWQETEMRGPGMSFRGCTIMLPLEVTRWLGLRSQGGAFRKDACGESGPNSLMEANDDTRLSFADIADLIESDKLELMEDTR